MIGHKGARLRDVGTRARTQIEALLGTPGLPRPARQDRQGLAAGPAPAQEAGVLMPAPTARTGRRLARHRRVARPGRARRPARRRLRLPLAGGAHAAGGQGADDDVPVGRGRRARPDADLPARVVRRLVGRPRVRGRARRADRRTASTCCAWDESGRLTELHGHGATVQGPREADGADGGRAVQGALSAGQHVLDQERRHGSSRARRRAAASGARRSRRAAGDRAGPSGARNTVERTRASGLVGGGGGPVAELGEVVCVEDAARSPRRPRAPRSRPASRRRSSLPPGSMKRDRPALADRQQRTVAEDAHRRGDEDGHASAVGRVGRPAAAVVLAGRPLLGGGPLVAPLVVERVVGHLAAGVLARLLAGLADPLLAGIGLARAGRPPGSRASVCSSRHSTRSNAGSSGAAVPHMP